jgi:twitching motility protein PilT
MMNERHEADFLRRRAVPTLPTRCDVDGVWRFRVNMLSRWARSGWWPAASTTRFPDFNGLYPAAGDRGLCHYDQGMVLLAGVTGSGKSTTIASMLELHQPRERVHILTLEDPIEFVFTEDKALINQRESRHRRQGLQDRHEARRPRRPDIMLVGEMRDEETFMTAIHAAETGHLVFGTIHASSARRRSAVFWTCSPKRCTRRSAARSPST